MSDMRAHYRTVKQVIVDICAAFGETDWLWPHNEWITQAIPNLSDFTRVKRQHTCDNFTKQATIKRTPFPVEENGTQPKALIKCCLDH